MRIAIFSETYLPDVNGVATHVKILADGLKKLGHDVLIVTADANTHKNNIDTGVLRCPAITAKKIYNYSLSSPISWGRLNIIKKFNPDIIHIHNEFGIGLSGALIAKRLKIPYVYTLHTVYDDYIHYIAKKPLVPLVKDASHIYLKQLGKRATAITGPSQKVNDFFKSRGINKPITIISNSAEIDIFNPSMIDFEKSNKFRADNNIDPDDFVGCFCGRLGKEKGIDTLLKFWQKSITSNMKLKLVIFGGGPEQESLENLAKTLGISDMIIFTGKIPHEELSHYYYACNFYITASLSEMHSISMIEAMASGLPVLYIRDKLNECQIIEGINGYLYSDKQEMFEKISLMKNMTKDEFNEFQNKVRQSISQYGDENIATVLLEVYKKSIEKYER